MMASCERKLAVFVYTLLLGLITCHLDNDCQMVSWTYTVLQNVITPMSYVPPVP